MQIALNLTLPAWIPALIESHAGLFDSDEDKMRLAIELSRENVARQTGGPFGAAIFEENTNTLVSVGVNAVVAENLSIAHAETIATMLAQKKLGTFDLAQSPDHKYALYSSGQPCIMCYGVTWWSGITRLVCAARSEDIESLTDFKEGPLPDKWPQQLAHREGLPEIEVVQDVLREEACAILREYTASGLPVYNAGGSTAIDD